MKRQNVLRGRYSTCRGLKHKKRWRQNLSTAPKSSRENPRLRLNIFKLVTLEEIHWRSICKRRAGTFQKFKIIPCDTLECIPYPCCTPSSQTYCHLHTNSVSARSPANCELTTPTPKTTKYVAIAHHYKLGTRT